MNYEEYHIIIQPNPVDLALEAEKMLANGWVCQGGLVITHDYKFAQAFVRQ